MPAGAFYGQEGAAVRARQVHFGNKKVLVQGQEGASYGQEAPASAPTTPESALAPLETPAPVAAASSEPEEPKNPKIKRWVPKEKKEGE